jgi:hypothetical protein
MPAEGIGECAKGLSGISDGQFEPREGGIGQGGPTIGQAGPSLPMAVFIPPTVLDEVQAVFHLPMMPHILQQLFRRDFLRVQTRHEVPRFADWRRAFFLDFSIDA